MSSSNSRKKTETALRRSTNPRLDTNPLTKTIRKRRKTNRRR